MRHFRRWGAVYILVVLFAGSWVGQLIAQTYEFAAEQAQHGGEFSWQDFWPPFFSATFENWQSEWLQLVFQAILLLGAKHWLFQVDAEDIERIEAKIDALHDKM